MPADPNAPGDARPVGAQSPPEQSPPEQSAPEQSAPAPREPVTRTARVAQQVHHHAVFQEDVPPVESYGVLPSAVLTVAAVTVAVATLATGAGAGTDLWFVRPSAVLAVAIGVVGTPLLVRRRRLVRARTPRTG